MTGSCVYIWLHQPLDGGSNLQMAGAIVTIDGLLATACMAVCADL